MCACACSAAVPASQDSLRIASCAADAAACCTSAPAHASVPCHPESPLVPPVLPQLSSGALLLPQGHACGAEEPPQVSRLLWLRRRPCAALLLSQLAGCLQPCCAAPCPPAWSSPALPWPTLACCVSSWHLHSHDVVLLCVACHELAQQAAEKLKQQLATECNVPLQPPRPLAVPWPPAARGQRALQAAAGGGGGEASAADAAAAAAAAKPDMHPHNVRRSALALQRYADSMPARKRRQLEAQVRAYLDATGSLIGAGSSGGSATSGVAGSSSEAAISGRAAGTAAGAPAAEGSPEKPAAGEGGLTPVELYSGLLAGQGGSGRVACAGGRLGACVRCGGFCVQQQGCLALPARTL